MSLHIELIRAVLLDVCRTDEKAQDVLETALLREVDPLDYCAMTMGVGQAVVSQRCADWLQLAHVDAIPSGWTTIAPPPHLDALAQARTVRIRIMDRDVLFCSPGFFEVIRLRQRSPLPPHLSNRVCLMPHNALRDFLAQASSEALTDAARQRLARRWPFATAHLELTLGARIVFVAGLFATLALVLVSPFLEYPVLLPFVFLVLAIPAAIRLAGVFRSLATRPAAPLTRPQDNSLPVYSVLIPLCDEAHMVPQLVGAMLNLDYPVERLDIIFVVEDRCAATLAAIRPYLHHAHFSLVAVPDSQPRTKPKALDYALPLARGEHLVVYDAEDTPEPDQLWQAAVCFRDHPETHCIQAELQIDNGAESLLTAIFAGEYAGQFGLLLPALAHWNLPIPLGGTSNHFRLSTLRQLGGWDAYNVTEDADLGARLARARHRVRTLSAGTREEAPTDLAGWLAQRTRWMKGWMQTFIVHSRRPRLLLDEVGWRGFVAFELMAIGMICAPLLHSAFVVLTSVRLLLGLPVFGDHGSVWQLLHFSILVFGYTAPLLQALVGLNRLKRRGLALQQLALPLYWILVSLATLRALYELLERPFYWAKTTHRVARAKR